MKTKILEERVKALESDLKREKEENVKLDYQLRKKKLKLYWHPKG